MLDDQLRLDRTPIEAAGEVRWKTERERDSGLYSAETSGEIIGVVNDWLAEKSGDAAARPWWPSSTRGSLRRASSSKDSKTLARRSTTPYGNGGDARRRSQGAATSIAAKIGTPKRSPAISEAKALAEK